MKNNFDRIASVYDFLAGIVFWGAINRSQEAFLDRLESGSRVLILGGGSGQLLPWFVNRRLTLKIDYVEKSAKMLRMAEDRVTGIDSELEIEFHHSDFEEWEGRQAYDAVLCFYFLDVFRPESLSRVLNRCINLLEDRGELYVADFQNVDSCIMRIVSKALIWSMHVFFRLFTGLESASLQDIRKTITNKGGSSLQCREYYGRMIFSEVYSFPQKN